MKVSGVWLSAHETQRVLSVLEDAGHLAFCVGGCVRNAILGVPVADVDIATDAHPEIVIDLAKSAGMQAVPTGIDHGTITVINNGHPFEVTTFRADVETDGRRAVVRFADDIQEDARRRDFTMNALYAAADGTVVDPLGGLPDAQARIIRFIDDAEDRIREDYLRTLRFFRFHAWYADQTQGFDPDALSAIASNLDGLDRLSAERVGVELTKLLSAPDPAPAVAVMQQVGVLPRILPGADARALAPLVHLEASLTPDPLRRMAALGVFDGARLRLSRAAQKQLGQYQSLIGDAKGPGELGYRFGEKMACDVLLLRSALLETPFDPEDVKLAQRGASAQFPLSAKDLMPGLSGKALGDRLRVLEDRWIASGFTLGRDALLS